MGGGGGFSKKGRVPDSGVVRGALMGSGEEVLEGL